MFPGELGERVRLLNDQPLNRRGRYVVYWAQVNRRLQSNEALLAAVELGNYLGRPIWWVESLPWPEQRRGLRFVRFLLEGVEETARGCWELGIGYTLLVEDEAAPLQELQRLLRGAAALVTDDYPVPPVPERTREVLRGITVAAYAVNASTIVPMRRFARREYAAYSMRPKLLKVLPNYLVPLPFREPRVRFQEDSTHTEIHPPSLLLRWERLGGAPPSVTFRGGRSAALQWLERFLNDGLQRYSAERHVPAARAASELSPYLHYGYISAREVALAVRSQAQEHGWDASSFLEQLIVRRELAFNFACFTKRLDSLEALPTWALQTIARHREDPRPVVYDIDRLEAGETHDDLWNAAHKELLLRGKIHNAPRMYWGKKILEWSAGPEQALASLLRFHDRYALDANDPNTYANILWCFGLHDRPFRERPILGTLRSFSRESFGRKIRADRYIAEISALAAGVHNRDRVK